MWGSWGAGNMLFGRMSYYKKIEGEEKEGDKTTCTSFQEALLSSPAVQKVP